MTIARGDDDGDVLSRAARGNARKCDVAIEATNGGKDIPRGASAATIVLKTSNLPTNDVKPSISDDACVWEEHSIVTIPPRHFDVRSIIKR